MLVDPWHLISCRSFLADGLDRSGKRAQSAVRSSLLFLVCLSFPLQLFGAEAVSLGQVLHQLESDSPQLSASRAQADAASAGVTVAKSRYWGHAELFARDTHYNNARLVNPISPPINFSTFAVDRDQYGYGAVLTLPLDIDGRITAAVHAQEHMSQAAGFQVADMRLELFSQAVSLYRGLQRVAGSRQALQRQHQALLKHHDITMSAIRVGRLARVELLRIDAELKSVEGQIATLNGEESRLRAGLASLLNRKSFGMAVELSDALPRGMPSLESSQPADEKLLLRPDVQGAVSMMRAQDENLKGARREWLPSLSVQAVTSRNQGYTAAGENTWSVTGQLTWQLWDGGRRFAHADQAQANREAARQQQIAVRNRARAELEAAMASWHAANLQFEAAQAGLKAAEETEKIQSERYRNGRLSVLDMLDAEAALSKARSNLSNAMANWWLADDQLHLAVGKEPAAYQQQAVEESSP